MTTTPTTPAIPAATATPGAHGAGESWVPKFLRPPVAAAPITDRAVVAGRYAALRPRILLWTTFGYAMFYFVRKNLSVAMPVMGQDLKLTKADLGTILTVHGLLYGVSKFGNGIVADRANARIFMPLALAVSAVLNVCFGLSSALVFLGVFWLLNGWVQGMGYPPCARLLTHWFAPREIATKMSFWNASHTLGGAGILALCGWLVERTGNWRLCFFVPAGIAVVAAALLYMFLRDTPESVGLPGIETLGAATAEQAPTPATMTAHDRKTYRAFLWRQVFSNKYIWLVSAANFFVYTIRFAAFDWGPTLLKETKGVSLSWAAWMTSGFEMAGFAGMLVTGWLTDRTFKGRAAPLCLASMLLCGISVLLFWKTPAHHVWLNTALLMCIGFFVYSPQALVAVIVVNQATKRAAATAVGLTSIFGYASTVFSGWGTGWLVQNYGWDPAFVLLIVAAGLGAALFAAALPARAHTYDLGGQEP
jgi:OPA family glycerol-3-phosphate transporter-like MFS transporter/OPA family sugar phosphate sensor protein UhpC-like MFS transporter